MVVGIGDIDGQVDVVAQLVTVVVCCTVATWVRATLVVDVTVVEGTTTVVVGAGLAGAVLFEVRVTYAVGWEARLAMMKVVG